MTGQHAQPHDHVDPTRIIVGVGTSAPALGAVDVAAELAEESGRPLHLVRVWRGVDWFLSASANQIIELRAEELAEQRMLVTEYLRVRELAPNVPATCEFTPGSVYEILLRESNDASLLVLGTSADTEASPGEWFLQRAHCPVLVVRPDATIAASTDARLEGRRGSRSPETVG